MRECADAAVGVGEELLLLVGAEQRRLALLLARLECLSVRQVLVGSADEIVSPEAYVELWKLTTQQVTEDQLRRAEGVVCPDLSPSRGGYKAADSHHSLVWVTASTKSKL